MKEISENACFYFMIGFEILGKEYVMWTWFKFWPMKIWLWFVYKFAENYCRLWLSLEFIQTRKSLLT